MLAQMVHIEETESLRLKIEYQSTRRFAANKNYSTQQNKMKIAHITRTMRRLSMNKLAILACKKIWIKSIIPLEITHCGTYGEN